MSQNRHESTSGLAFPRWLRSSVHRVLCAHSSYKRVLYGLFDPKRKASGDVAVAQKQHVFVRSQELLPPLRIELRKSVPRRSRIGMMHDVKIVVEK